MLGRMIYRRHGLKVYDFADAGSPAGRVGFAIRGESAGVHASCNESADPASKRSSSSATVPARSPAVATTPSTYRSDAVNRLAVIRTNPTPGGLRHTVWILLTVLLGLGLPTARAGELTAPPTFLIESIEVEGARHASPELVQSESWLSAGETYTEPELRQAVFRIQRLPFVLSADFVLAKGSERGRYRLVIRIEEIRRWFFGEDTTYTRFTNSVAFDSLFGRHHSLTPGGQAGIRLFLGKYNMVFGSLSSRGGMQAGFTRYNLFNRRAVLSLGLTNQSCCPIRIFPLGLDPTFSSWRNEGDLREARLTLGLPLQRRFQLRLQATESYSERGERRDLLSPVSRPGFPRVALDYEDLNRFQLEVALDYDSTDDAIFPSRGLAWSLALDFHELDAELAAQPASIFTPDVILPPGVDELPVMRSEQLRLSAGLTQHWLLHPRHTATLAARLAIGRADVTNLTVLDPGPDGDVELRLIDDRLDVLESYFTARWSTDLWGPGKTRSHGNLRLENTVEFGYDRLRQDLGAGENPLYRKSFTTSLVFRNSWGLFRFSLQIADYGRGF